MKATERHKMWSPLDTHLESMILKQRGQNQLLAQEVLEKLSVPARERLFRLLQGLDNETIHARSKLRRLGLR